MLTGFARTGHAADGEIAKARNRRRGRCLPVGLDGKNHAPDQADHNLEMAPMIAVNRKALKGVADKSCERHDKNGPEGRGIFEGAKSRFQREKGERQKTGDGHQAAGNEDVHIDVMRHQAPDMGPLKQANPKWILQCHPERTAHAFKAAAFSDIVFLGQGETLKELFANLGNAERPCKRQRRTQG